MFNLLMLFFYFAKATLHDVGIFYPKLNIDIVLGTFFHIGVELIEEANESEVLENCENL